MVSELHACFLLAFAVSIVVSKQHVIRITPKLRAQGFDEDIELGEVMAEAVVDSPEACGRLCAENPACHSVMLMGQLCRMFVASLKCPCSEKLTYITQHSRYLIGQDASMTSFNSAMAMCSSLGAHSVHINSKEEHDVIKQYIRDSGLNCPYVWTGGWSDSPGSSNAADLRWLYSTDLNGPSQPVTYLAWEGSQPNNKNGGQHAIALHEWYDFGYNDLWETYEGIDCFLCECP